MKPRLRGVSHQYAFFVSLITGPLLALAAPTAKACVAASIYALSMTALLGASALYHRVTWTPRARFWMARLDLAMIFFLIAGSYTPIALLVLEPHVGNVVLWAAWSAAAAGIILKLVWQRPAKWATAAVYVASSSIGVFLMPEIHRALGGTAVALLVGGGMLYVAGALVYALERPNPVPAVFGYHEIFHAFVILAASVHYVAVAAYIIPAAV